MASCNLHPCLHAASAALGLMGVLGCDAHDPLPPLDGSSVQFRCAPLDVPGIGGLQTVTVNGNAAVIGVGVGFDLFSNGAIQLAGTAAITGGAYSVGSAIELFNSATVTGLPSADATRTGEIPNWLPIDAISIIHAFRDNDDVPDTSLGRDALSNDNMDLRLYGGDSLTLPQGYYSFDSISLSGGSTLDFSGWAYVVIDGEMSVSGGSEIVAPDARQVLFIGVSDEDIDISGGSEVTMRLYAPNAPVRINGASTQFNGGLLGGTLQMSGNTQMEVTEDALHIWRPC